MFKKRGRETENDRRELSLPIVLEVGGSADSDLRKAAAEIEMAAVYSNSIFRLIHLACGQVIGNVENTDELLSDIQNACVIGIGINLSVGESFKPISRLIHKSEEGGVNERI